MFYNQLSLKANKRLAKRTDLIEFNQHISKVYGLSTRNKRHENCQELNKLLTILMSNIISFKKIEPKYHSKGIKNALLDSKKKYS